MGKIMKNYRNVSFLNMKKDKILRSEALTDLTAEDIELLTKTIDVIVDLRTQEETKEDPDKMIDGIKYINIPLISDKDLYEFIESKNGNNPSFNEIYRFFVSDKSNASFKEIFKLLIELNGKRVLFHCSQGKDRTGIVIAIILKSLGVSDELIFKDYLKTNDGIVINKPFISESERSMLLSMMMVHDDYLASSLEEIDHLYDSFDNFLVNSCGMDELKIRELKKIYLN